MSSSAPPKPAARRKARRFLVQAFYQWQISETPVGEIEVQFRTDNAMHKVDLDFFHELLHDIPKCIDELEALYQPHLDRKDEGLDRIERAILWIGVYELKHRIDVPYQVVINEGIELAKHFGADDSHRYVNGVLDKLAKELREVEVNARSAQQQK